MNEFLSELLSHQEASLVIEPSKKSVPYLKGVLSITVRGKVETFTVCRATIEYVILGLQNKFLQNKWRVANE